MTAIALPLLREDLDLLEGPVSRDGEPTWTIFDPVRNRYFRIRQIAFDLLSHWYAGDSDRLLEAVSTHTGRSLQQEDVEWMIHFLRANFLVKRVSQDDIAQLEHVAEAGRTSFHLWLLHRYLFFRIPLVRPQKFLQKTMPYVEHLYSKKVLWVMLLLGLLGVFLVSRQWDTFLSTFLHFFSWDGVLWYALTLVIVKIIHELGHAYTAYRAGCRVPSMGVAFLVMWPVLYTDTTDAWRLRNRHQKLAIGAAGIGVELGLALIATLLWSFLPEGAAKSAAFLVATITWVMSLAINLNPLMRFDGYYLLSDWLEVDNLQDRSFALAKWWLRERLFGFDEPAPEYFTRSMRNGLIAFGIATWIYRFFLFLGIAILVYSFFFKLLGILLFVLELLWFIAVPIYRECKEWWNRRKTMTMNKRVGRTAIIAIAMLALGLIPWQRTIHLPSLYDAREQVAVYAPLPAKLEQLLVQRDDTVSKGQTLLTLSSEELEQSIKSAELQVQNYRLLLSRQSASYSDRQKVRITQQQLDSELAKLTSLHSQKELLKIKSPIDGVVRELDSLLQQGVWVNDSTPMLVVVKPKTGKLIAYISEKDVDRIRFGASAHFYPDELSEESFQASVDFIAETDTYWLEEPLLASVYGGSIAVEQDEKKRLTPLQGLYKIEFTINREAPESVQRGVVHIEAEAKSIFKQWFESIYAVLIRESGF